MGTTCSIWRKNSSIGLSYPEEQYKLEFKKKTDGSVENSIVYSTLCSPFRISRDEAEKLLQESYAGAFIFSHSITSEIFLSMSTGKYVCHHPVLKQAQYYVIGGHCFCNIEEAVKFYRTSPLGEATLTEQFHSRRQGQSKQQTNSTILNSPPKVQTNKQVAFNVRNSKSSTASGPVSIIVDNAGSASVVGGTTCSTSMGMDTKESSKDSLTEDELMKKILNKPRKSICRVQPEDSLSTSSDNMFKEETF